MATRKIKLLIAVPTLECGGLERNVSIICNHIDTDSFEVTLAILNNADQFFPITNPAVRLVDLRIKNVRKSLFAIAKLSREIKPDIILTASNHLNLFFGIFKWLFPRRIKIIARESSIMSMNEATNWNAGFYNWLSRNFYRRLDLIVCQSVFMQQDLISHFRVSVAKTRIINNAVMPPETFVRNVAPASNNVIQFITVARLSKEKGLDRIIRALSLLTIPFEYTIIGEGELRQALTQLINECSLNDKVKMPGRSDKPFAQVANPALFLMGSHYEGFPNVLLEANSLGIPVVAFDAPGGIGDLIINNENGMLVQGNSEEDFAAAVSRAIAHPFNREKISSDTKKQFAVSKIIRDWETLFQEKAQQR